MDNHRIRMIAASFALSGVAMLAFVGCSVPVDSASDDNTSDDEVVYGDPNAVKSPQSCQCTTFVICSTGVNVNKGDSGLKGAADWDNYAVRSGYHLSSTPVKNKVIVFERGAYGAGATYGHVAKVTSYSASGTNWVIHLIEGNGGGNMTSCGCNNVSTRTVTVPKNATNVHYIY
jgi:surface antigen